MSLDPLAPTTLSYVYSYSGFDTGDNLLVQFAADGVDFRHPPDDYRRGREQCQSRADDGKLLGDRQPPIRRCASPSRRLTDIEGIRIDDVSILQRHDRAGPGERWPGLHDHLHRRQPAPVAIALNAAVTNPINPNVLSAQVPADQCAGARRAVDRGRAPGRDHVELRALVSWRRSSRPQRVRESRGIPDGDRGGPLLEHVAQPQRHAAHHRRDGHGMSTVPARWRRRRSTSCRSTTPR